MDTTIPPLASIGIDIGKEVFHVVGFSTDGRIAFRRKIKRLSLVETFKRLPPSIVGMEACLRERSASEYGFGTQLHGSIATSWQPPWPTNWRGSPGASCATRRPSTPLVTR